MAKNTKSEKYPRKCLSVMFCFSIMVILTVFCEQNLISILNKVDFVDYIVFGRLHYNKEATAYKDHKKFYNECSKVVEDFCEAKNIKCHIKKGTKSEL